MDFDFIEDPEEVRKIDEEMEALRSLPDDERSAEEDALINYFEEKIDRLV